MYTSSIDLGLACSEQWLFFESHHHGHNYVRYALIFLLPNTTYPSSLSNVYLAWSAVLDFVLALFPWVALWNLNMKKKEKYTICLSLSLGILLVLLS